ncbi:hypothetical protein ACOSQ2_024822 [Xanthoceras sorbifolium]
MLQIVQLLEFPAIFFENSLWPLGHSWSRAEPSRANTEEEKRKERRWKGKGRAGKKGVSVRHMTGPLRFLIGSCFLLAHLLSHSQKLCIFGSLNDFIVLFFQTKSAHFHSSIQLLWFRSDS